MTYHITPYREQDVITDEEQRLIDDYLANGGKVTICPPRTYAIDETTPISLRDRIRAQANMYKKKRERKALNIAKFVDLAQTMTAAQIADHTGFHVRTVNKYLLEAGVEPVPHDAHKRQKVIELHKSGLSGRKIMAKTGFGKTFVFTTLKRLNGKLG